MTNKELTIKIAELVKKKGGKTYYVGGYVRDLFLGKESKDIDIEVYGITIETLKEILNEVGKPLEYGKEFGIFSLEGTCIDIALPRKEIKVSDGHRGFEIEVDPFIDEKEAARRRDFTINSMMLDVLTNELIDSYNGKKDLENRIIRHVDENSFVEDPLRVYRAAQFASRFKFEIDEKTIELCKSIDVTSLTKERVLEELKKALLESNKPSIFFDVLKQMNKLDYWFEEVKMTIGYEQNPRKHPEGDVYNHTMMMLDEATLFRNNVSNPFNFMILCLVHDFGKLRTKVIVEDGIHFFGHENSLDDAKNLIERLVSSNETKEYVYEMIPKHMKGHDIFKRRLDEYESNKWFDGVKHPKDLVYLATADKSNHRDPNRLTFLLNRYNIYNEIISMPHVTGQDLIDAGITQSERFKEYLDFAHDLTLKGFKKDNVLKETLKYIEE